MILIGENINIMSNIIGPALRERNPKPIQELAKAETETGVDYLDLNIGPARKAGDELMEWVVKTVQEVTNLPLSLDTTNPVAMEAGLRVHQGRALINSISLARMEEELPLVIKYNADMVGLLWGREGMPRDAAERGVIAVELAYRANEMGIPNEGIWFDVGLSNISNGTPTHLRPYLNQTYLMMLMKYGLYSAIVDAFDSELIKIAKGEKPELVDLVHRVMDGDKPDLLSLSEEEVKYVKTVRVLAGESLYSHSWLEI